METLKSTLIYDINAGVFSLGPALQSPRMDHSCGVINDAETGKRLVVISGGMGDYDCYLDSIEVHKKIF